mmetsp:Transcript_68224/g.148864  ORF Transcript_68224/g.148864 Transcript_68224/m.148864 type:complete len:112 (-) Transcript_68224:375-710(-)
MLYWLDAVPQLSSTSVPFPCIGVLIMTCVWTNVPVLDFLFSLFSCFLFPLVVVLSLRSWRLTSRRRGSKCHPSHPRRTSVSQVLTEGDASSSSLGYLQAQQQLWAQQAERG